MPAAKTAKEKGSSKKGRSKKGAPSGEPLLGAEQQRDLLALGLLALALFLTLALVPVSILGERGLEIFPSGNAVGPVGGVIDALLTAALGASAALVPVILLLTALWAGRWAAPVLSGRLAALACGLLLLLPLLFFVHAADPAWAGALGSLLGEPLVDLLGWLGTTLLVAVLVLALCVLTLRWNPLRTVGGGVVQGGGVVGRGLRGVRARWAEGRRVRQAAAPAGEAVGPDEPFERELGDGGTEGAGADGSAAGAGVEASGEPVAGEAPARGRSRKAKAAPAEPSAEDLPEPMDQRTRDGTPLPPLELLTEGSHADRADMERELDGLGEVLVEKLRTFNVESHVAGRTTGPVVTQFEVVPAPGVKVNRIANLDADLALAMKAESVRIVAPIPGKGAVGVEIPNPEPAIVQLREILEAREYRGARGELPLAMGRDLTGRPYVADLARMPHLLIAGATGSGKSVCINTVITSLVYRHTPETLRFLMIDPKMVELSAYQDLPHLRHPVVTDPKDAAGVLKWAVMEMERRYELLSANGVRSLGEFNKRVRDGQPVRRVEPDGPEGDEDRWLWKDGVLAHIVVVVDELADLMMTVQSEIEKPLAQLAQKARAIGIHLIVATQRPSVNVITGLIKANFPTRVAFRVASKTDSRTILDQNGAEALLGNGDMLFLPPGKSETVRIQGAFIDTEDTDRLLAWYRELRARLEAEAAQAGGEAPAPPSEPDILEEVRSHEMDEASAEIEEIAGEWDELFRAAAEVCVQHDQGSTSLLQRKLRIGYGRAARIMDQLESAGVIGPQDGTKPRDILITMGELDEICGPGA